MGVPQDIREVARPRNTVVVDTGSKGPLRYAVRARAGFTRTEKGFQPRNGKVIGHIVNGSFVPAKSRLKAAEWQTLGCAPLVADLAGDLRERLAELFGEGDADHVLALASTHILHPYLGLDMQAALYKGSLASLVFPGLDLTEKNIHALYARLGKKGTEALFTRPAPDQAQGTGSSYLMLLPAESVPTLASLGAEPCRNRGLFLTLRPCDTGFEPLYGQFFDATGDIGKTAAKNATEGCVLFTAREECCESLRSRAKEKNLHYLVPARCDDKARRKLSLDDLEVVDGVDCPCQKKRSPDDEYLSIFASAPFAAPFQTSPDQSQGKKKKNKKARESAAVPGIRVFRSDMDLPLPLVAKLAREEELWQRIAAHLAPVQSSWPSLREKERKGAGLVFLVAALVTRRIVQRAKDGGLLEKTHLGHILALLATLLCRAKKDESYLFACEAFRPALSDEAALMLQDLGIVRARPAQEADSE